MFCRSEVCLQTMLQTVLAAEVPFLLNCQYVSSYIQALPSQIWLLVKYKRRGSHYFSLILLLGSRIASCKDKQLELAHAIWILQIEYNTSNVDAPLRIFLHFDLRDLAAEENVRKRPINNE